MESSFEITSVSWGYGSDLNPEDQLLTDTSQGMEPCSPPRRTPCAIRASLEAKLHDALVVDDLARLRTVVAVPAHAPLWLYWARQLQDESGDSWTDGALPVMACAALAVPAVGEGQMHGGAVMVCDGWHGPLWLRVVSPEPAWATEGIGASWHVSTCHAEPVLGGLAAPDWIKEGRSYAPAPLRGEPCPPWRS